MIEKKTLNNYLSLSISLILIIFFSLYQINLEDLWFDELLTFSITNPELDNSETYNLLIDQENTPPVYYFLLKTYFEIFNYDYQLLRLPNVFFNSISLIVFFLILKEFSKDNKFIFLSLILFSLNYFLISYAHEGRVYSFYCSISLIFIKFYLSILSEEKPVSLSKSLFFCVLSIILINTFLFSFLIICTVIFFEFFFRKNKKNFFLIIFILVFSIITSILINFDYYEKVLSFQAISINNPNLDFFLLNFFFKDFFGSKIMGLIFFIFFVFSLFISFKNNLFNEKLIFLILLIFFSYLVPILYGYIFQPVLLDKYIFYVVPIIILFISFSINNLIHLRKKIVLISFLIILTFSNQVLKNKKKEVDKPEFTKILKILNNQYKSNFYATSFMDHKTPFFNLIVENLIQQIIEKRNFKLIKNKNKKKYWIICYDPSSSFDYCAKDSALFDKKNIKEIIKTYQVAAILVDKK